MRRDGYDGPDTTGRGLRDGNSGGDSEVPPAVSGPSHPAP
jgi:hypothetical protein